MSTEPDIKTRLAEPTKEELQDKVRELSEAVGYIKAYNEAMRFAGDVILNGCSNNAEANAMRHALGVQLEKATSEKQKQFST